MDNQRQQTQRRAAQDIESILAQLGDMMTPREQALLLTSLAAGGGVSTATMRELLDSKTGRGILRGLALVGLCRLMGLWTPGEGGGA